MSDKVSDHLQRCAALGSPHRGAGTTVALAALAAILSSGPGGVSASDPDRPKSSADLIYLDTPAGEKLLEESKAKGGLTRLNMHFVTQENLAYCGVASTCMVLNATGIDRPTSPEHAPFKLFTQSNLFSEEVKKVAPPDRVRRVGMPLKTLGEMLAAHPVKAEVVHAGDSSVAEFRKAAVEALTSRDSYLVVNYLRKAIGQETGGHISPVGAYHEGEDRFLILDVARYKYAPVWVKADDLFRAMGAVDGDSKKSRGFVIVRAEKRER